MGFMVTCGFNNQIINTFLYSFDTDRNLGPIGRFRNLDLGDRLLITLQKQRTTSGSLNAEDRSIAVAVKLHRCR